MQYKIPVQIENEDPIFMNLSLRQLGIIMGGCGLSYSLYTSLIKSAPQMVALAPSLMILAVFVIIALFRVSEMTFLPFILNTLRLKINGSERVWLKGVDSYTSFEIGYITRDNIPLRMVTQTKNNAEIYDDISEKLKKL